MENWSAFLWVFLNRKQVQNRLLVLMVFGHLGPEGSLAEEVDLMIFYIQVLVLIIYLWALTVLYRFIKLWKTKLVLMGNFQGKLMKLNIQIKSSHIIWLVRVLIIFSKHFLFSLMANTDFLVFGVHCRLITTIFVFFGHKTLYAVNTFKLVPTVIIKSASLTFISAI